MHYPSIVGANGRIAPENISLNGGWKPIDVNEPVGVSIHQDLGWPGGGGAMSSSSINAFLQMGGLNTVL